MTIWEPTISADKPRHAALLDALVADVHSGRLKPGSRLPTQRELAEQLGLSLGTVTRAYAAAQRRGLIKGEIGRGTFVMGEGDDRYGAAEFDLNRPGIIDLAVVRPLYDLEPDLAGTLRRLARRPGLSDLLYYQPNAGTLRHRKAGADWATRYGIETGPDRVLVCAGTQHALTVTLSAVCKPGDALLVEELTYPGVRALANLLELKLIPLAMDDGGLIPESFEAACRQGRAKVLFTMPTGHNPTTATIPAERRREIAELAARFEVAVVEDTVNHLLAENPPPPLCAFAPEVGYFMASLSKAVTGGLRVAYLVAPERSVPDLTKAVWATNWMTAPLCAEIAAMWIEEGTADETCTRKKAEARRRVALAREILKDFDVRCDDNGHHAWLSLPECWRGAAQFAEEARRAGVAVAPADLFCVGPNAPAAVRLALSTPGNMETLSAGLVKLKNLLAGPPGLGAAIL